MVKFLTLIIAIFLFACKSQQVTYYEANTEDAPKTSARIDFEPAMKGDKAVKVRYDMPVKFGLQ